jgi:hypothetical protein
MGSRRSQCVSSSSAASDRLRRRGLRGALARNRCLGRDVRLTSASKSGECPRHSSTVSDSNERPRRPGDGRAPRRSRGHRETGRLSGHQVVRDVGRQQSPKRRRASRPVERDPSSTAAVAFRHASSVSSASNSASLSSCRSLLYPLGSPFIVVSHPVRRPMTRPALPRTSSSGSGFFFCGIRLLPVAAVSCEFEEAELLGTEDDHVFAEPAQVHHRERTAWRNSATKSRSRRVEAVLDHAREPEAAGQGGRRWRSGPGHRARSERQLDRVLVEHARKRSWSRRPLPRARGRSARQDRLRAPHVRVRRHQRVTGSARACREHATSRDEAGLQAGDAALEVEPQVERHLLVARPAGVQALAELAHALTSSRSTKACTSSSWGLDRLERTPHRAPLPDLLEASPNAAASSADSTPAPRAPRPTPGCPRRRRRAGGGRSGRRRRTRRGSASGSCRSGRTTDSPSGHPRPRPWRAPCARRFRPAAPRSS